MSDKFENNQLSANDLSIEAGFQTAREDIDLGDGRSLVVQTSNRFGAIVNYENVSRESNSKKFDRIKSQALIDSTNEESSDNDDQQSLAKFSIGDEHMQTRWVES